MFTGIISEVGKIKKIESVSGKRQITISCQTLQANMVIGESVACNGICLTVIKYTADSVTFEVMNQTNITSTASLWQVSSSIHLEKALRLDDRLNGHIVQGHVDTISLLLNRHYENSTLYLEFSLPCEYSHLVVEHGSICIDGVSLTIARLFDNRLQVALIEHTLKMTHFDSLKINDYVNLEFDIIGKYVQRLIGCKKNDKMTEEWLRKNGF